MSTEKKCSICGAPFIDKSRCKLREVCFSSECIDERRRRNQNARNARQAEARRLAPDYVPPRRGRPKSSADQRFNAFDYIPSSRFDPNTPKFKANRKPAESLDTAAVEAAVAANPMNRKCPKCTRAFFGNSKFCGGAICNRAIEERGTSRRWDGPQLRNGQPILRVA